MQSSERENYLLTKRAAGHLVLEEMGAVRQALGQIRSIVADAITPLGHAIQSMNTSDLPPEAKTNAVRSLQFADMVEQLAAYCDAELDNVEQLARDLNDLVNTLMDNGDASLDTVLMFQQTLNARLDALRHRLADRGHKSVLQDNMTEGDIELF